MDLLPAMLRGDSGGSKFGESMLEVDKPVASASFSFKLRLDFDGSNCLTVQMVQTKRKMVQTERLQITGSSLLIGLERSKLIEILVEERLPNCWANRRPRSPVQVDRYTLICISIEKANILLVNSCGSFYCCSLNRQLARQ